MSLLKVMKAKELLPFHVLDVHNLIAMEVQVLL